MSSHTASHVRQLPLWPQSFTIDHGNPWPRRRQGFDWLELARTLPANLSLELTADHGWRIVALTLDARHAVELLDITEGDVIPDAVMLERRRRHVEAHLLLEQALAVLRAVQADNETCAARRRRMLSVVVREATA